MPGLSMFAGSVRSRRHMNRNADPALEPVKADLSRVVKVEWPEQRRASGTHLFTGMPGYHMDHPLNSLVEAFPLDGQSLRQLGNLLLTAKPSG
jgi:hypothetical protein